MCVYLHSTVRPQDYIIIMIIIIINHFVNII